MLSIKDLSFRYDRGGFSLSIPELNITQGEKAAFTGPSGCGKTTLLFLLAGILKPVRGAVILGGQNLSELPDSACRSLRLKKMGFVFQKFELLEYLTGLENILLTSHLTPGQKVTAGLKDRARALVESMGVSHLLRRSPSRMSQGEQQRIAICRAMIHAPELVIADEPTGSLDPSTARIIMNLLLSQVEKQHAAFLMVTHDHSLLASFDRVIDFSAFTGKGA